MSIPQVLVGGYTNLAVVDAADFDGSNDFMTTGAGLTGAADSKTGILSCWIRIDSGDGNTRAIFEGETTVGGATPRFTFFILGADNTIRIAGSTTAGAATMTIISDTAYTAGATWLHVLASWTLATTTGQLYINDTEDLAAGSAFADNNIDYTLADWAVGAAADGSVKFSGCIAELWVTFGTSMDLSVESNRRKFSTANGKPVFLGTTGELPTGTAPLVYQHIVKNAAVTTFATNSGTGGNFSITGTLETCSSSPSG